MLHASGLHKGTGYTSWSQSLYYLVRSWEQGEEERTFWLNSCPLFFPLSLRCKNSLLLLPPNSRVHSLNSAQVLHLSFPLCICFLTSSVLLCISSLSRECLVIFAWASSLPLRWWKQSIPRQTKKERELDLQMEFSTRYWVGQEHWASYNDRSGFE